MQLRWPTAIGVGITLTIEIYLSQNKLSDMTEMANPNRQTTAIELTKTIANLRRVMRRTQHDLFSDRVFTTSEYEFLRYVADHEGVRVGHAADALSIAPNTASTIVKRLLGLGVVKRSATISDRRVGELSLTERGRAILSTLSDHRTSLLEAAMANLPDEAEEAIQRAIPALNQLIGVVNTMSLSDLEKLTAAKWR